MQAACERNFEILLTVSTGDTRSFAIKHHAFLNCTGLGRTEISSCYQKNVFDFNGSLMLNTTLLMLTQDF